MTPEQTKTVMSPEDIRAKQELDAKPFNELTDSQKIDRVVEHIESMKQSIAYTQRTINRLERSVRTLKKHTHTTDGKCVVDVELADQEVHGGDAIMGRGPASLR